MKKIYSLLKACMTSDMNIFQIKQKRNSKKSRILLPFVLSFLFMFAIWSNANIILKTCPNASTYNSYIIGCISYFYYDDY